MELFFESLRALNSNKLRTFLSMLGIIIGVTAVIAVIAIGTGTTEEINKTVASLGSNVIIAIPSSNSNFKFNFANEIENMAPNISKATGILQSSAPVSYSNNNTSSTIYASSPNIFQVLNLNIEYGREINESDFNKNNIVIGNRIARNLFNNINPLGETVYLTHSNREITRKIPFKIVGVIERTGSRILYDADRMIIMHYNTGDSRLFHTQGSISQIIVSAKNEFVAKNAMLELDFYLNNKFDNERAYNLISQDSILSVMNQITTMMNLLLLAIAAISLLVGGIGIMNIMLVSVTERTREIGIKMALGATRKRILTEFLIESVLITFVAGIIGIILGAALSNFIAFLAREYQLKSVVNLFAVLIAFGISTSIGLFFGIYPASKASKLSPIEALRYE